MPKTVPKIVSCEITPLPKQLFDPMPRVIATFDDGATLELFEYYPDEISFTPAELVGLTEEGAHELKFRKDVTFLKT